MTAASKTTSSRVSLTFNIVSSMGKTCVFLFVFAVFVCRDAGAQENPAVTKTKNQRQVALLYNFAHIGHNLALNYNHYFGRHALVGGIKYHLATTIHNRNSRFDGFKFTSLYSYRGPAAATAGNFRDKVGINLGYIYQLKRAKSWLSPYLFYQLQATFSLTAYNDIYQTGSYTIFENTVGAGIQPLLRDRLHLDASAGIGPALFYGGTDLTTAPNPSPWFRERVLLVRVGVFYQLRK